MVITFVTTAFLYAINRQNIITNEEYRIIKNAFGNMCTSNVSIPSAPVSVFHISFYPNA
jgi:hypothetical protein